MNKNTKKYLKTNLIGFIIGGLLISGVAVYAAITFPSNEVSYENGASGLSSTNVQGAIDELYKTCTATAGSQILDKVDIVTSGDGLYEDEYEDGKYTYKGANPNNYLTFNGETAGWRIISINSDGTIKIVKNADINTSSNLAWDTSEIAGGISGNNNWNRPATLNTYLNGTYYNGLTSTAQSQIVESSYYAGTIESYNNDMQNQISDEKSTTSKVKVALPTASEYIRSNSNKNSCSTYKLNEDHIETCRKTNWMFNRKNWWTMTPYSNYSLYVHFINIYGSITTDPYVFDTYLNVFPVVTLSSDLKITGGDGSYSNPYTIK